MLKVFLVFVLFIHTFFSIKSYGDFGFLGFFPPFKDSNTTQIFSDLVISLSLVNLWIFLDLKKLGKPLIWILPICLGTLISGSYAVICYFLFRKPSIVSKTDFI